MPTSSGVTIVNLRAFQGDLKRALGAYPRELTRALKLAGTPLPPKARGFAPVVTGTLAGGYTLSVRGTTGSLVNAVPYAAGAEWGLHGKWSGFTKYPSAPGTRGGRFAYRAVIESEAEMEVIVTKALESIFRAHGWFN